MINFILIDNQAYQTNYINKSYYTNNSLPMRKSYQTKI